VIADFKGYDHIEPFGDRRANWHSAMISYILARSNTPKEKPVNFADFMWQDAHSRREEGTQRAFQVLRALKRGGSSETDSQPRGADGKL